MDYHRQFRLAHLNRPPSTLFGPKRTRFPASSIPPIPRSECNPPPAHSPSAPPDPHSAAADLTASAPSRQSPQPVGDSPQVREQVKQLQFWLKVFARFCHDDADEE